MTHAAVTVVIPTHDRQDLLAETLASIRAQTVPVELIVVDDASRDGTAEWLASQDVRTLRHEVARGGPASRNAGAALATAPWLAFCDDDDLWAPDRLQAQLAVLADHPTARWATTGAVSIDRSRHVIGGQALPDRDDLRALLRTGNAVPGGGSGVLIDTELFAAAGGFGEDLEGCDDWDLWLRLAERSPIGYVHRPLVAYRRWPGNRSRDLDRARRAHRALRARYGIPQDIGSEGRQAWRLHRARHHAEAGDGPAAAAIYARAALSGPAPGQLAYAAASLVSTGRVVRRLQGLDRARLPEGWLEEARRWLGAR